MRRLVPGLVLVLALAGCSQIAAVAPVGGAHLAEVRFATADVLVANDVEIMIGPDCTQSGDEVICTGETVDGTSIATVSTATTLTVTVNGATLYDGSIQDVLDSAARPAS